MRASEIHDAQLKESTWRPGTCPASQSLPVYSQSLLNFKDHPRSIPKAAAKAPTIGAFAYIPPQRGRSPSRLSDASTEEMSVGKVLTARSSSEPSLVIRPEQTKMHVQQELQDVQAQVLQDCAVTPRRSEQRLQTHICLQDSDDDKCSARPSAAEEACKQEKYVTYVCLDEKDPRECVAKQTGRGDRKMDAQQDAFKRTEPRVKCWLSHVIPLWQRSGSSPELGKASSHAHASPLPEASKARTYASNFTRAKQSSLNTAKGALRHALNPCRALTASAPAKNARQPAKAFKEEPKPKPKLAARTRPASAGCQASWQLLRDENAALQARKQDPENPSNPLALNSSRTFRQSLRGPLRSWGSSSV